MCQVVHTLYETTEGLHIVGRSSPFRLYIHNCDNKRYIYSSRVFSFVLSQQIYEVKSPHDQLQIVGQPSIPRPSTTKHCKRLKTTHLRGGDRFKFDGSVTEISVTIFLYMWHLSTLGPIRPRSGRGIVEAVVGVLLSAPVSLVTTTYESPRWVESGTGQTKSAPQDFETLYLTILRRRSPKSLFVKFTVSVCLGQDPPNRDGWGR